MNVKCGNCSKAVLLIGGQWQHVWRIKNEDGTSGLGGSPMCAWRSEPRADPLFAEPADEQKTPA
jgi:hypothetical protein